MAYNHRSVAKGRALLLAALTLLGALLGAPFGAATSAQAKPGYIVVDAETGLVLTSRDADKRRHPASLTKMMTLYLTFEALEDGRLTADQKLVVSAAAAKAPPTRIGLRRGDRISVRDAIRASAIRSANDAAVVLAEALGGTESDFAVLMTRKARALGMTETSFRNATGLTRKGHLSTPRDMAILARQLQTDFPDYYHLFSRTKVRVKGRVFRATNTLLGRVKGVDGMKTGYTRAAGYNLAASAERRDRRVIVSFMGGKTRRLRDGAVAHLIDEGFKRLKRGETQGLLAAAWTAPRPSPNPRRLDAAPAAKPTAKQEIEREEAPAAADDLVAKGEMRAVAAAARPSKTGRLQGETVDGWSVQLAAYFDMETAKRGMDSLKALEAPGLEQGARKLVTARLKAKNGAKPRTVHRLRVVGLSEADAKRACDHLKTQRRDCAVVPPDGWGASRLAMR